MGSCDMFPLPHIPRLSECGMPNPALTQAWAHMGPCLAPGPGPGPGPSLSTADLKQKRLLEKTTFHIY